MSPNIGTGQTKHICGLNLTNGLPIHEIGHSIHGVASLMGCRVPHSSAKDTQVGEKGADLDGGARKSARHLSHTSYSTLLTVLRDNHCSQCIVYPQNDGQEKQNSLCKVTQL